ncbi:alpha/beta hydrolase [Pseudomonas japonica]|uniref:alpha/beta hydrolase n=1 Tax=Pseudomonas japonica TaxID=256466 RepID=UPI0015E48088|nr:alpha/beta hydrolase [Pseudomonas japonica]MBA1242495.1 alpha/beta hydrolase [Pseudomonas japonica]
MPVDNYRPNPDLLAYAQQGRASYRGMIPRAGVPDPVAEVRDMDIPVAHLQQALAARLYVPATPSSEPCRPVVLFLHGGGFICGDLDTHDVMLRALANRSGALVISLAYRLAPEAPFPAALEDTFAALTWLKANAQELGGDQHRLIVCGDSAGGNLAAAVCLLARERGGPGIAGQVLFYPNLDGIGDTASWAALGDRYFPTRAAMELTLQCYVPGPTEQRHDPLVAPLRAALHGLPPALVISAGLDPLKDEGRAYALKLREAGVAAQETLYPEVEHGFVQFFKEACNGRMGEQALDQAAAFVKACR